MKIYTIGFTKKSARTFFTKLREANGLSRLIDVRLNNVSQLAGFAKKDDLTYFLEELCHVPYLHELQLAPTKPLLDSYKKERGAWSEYEERFLALMKERRIEDKIHPDVVDNACLLCSEDKPHMCHRRLVAEYLQKAWGDVNIVHL